MLSKPTIPEVIGDFRAYYEANISWGSLHIVLDDGNVKDSDVLFCYHYALERDDQTGAHLASILLRMSKTQRLKLSSTITTT